MAVQGAHLTSTAMADEDAPSIFEVLAQESLMHSLKPALQHVFRILAESNPARYGRIYNYSDELYTGLHLILENYYLKHYSSSFSENFYGIKRVLSSKEENKLLDQTNGNVDEENEDALSEESINGIPLPHSNRMKSLIFLVLVPYFKNKCEVYYEQLSESQDACQGEGFKAKLCRAFLGMYPVLHFVWQSTMLYFQLAYIFSKSPYHSPLLRAAGVLLQNMSMEDMQRSPVHPLTLKDKSWWRKLLTILKFGVSGFAIALSHGLSVGVFFLQFLEWWYASDQHATSLTALPTPPPPQPLKIEGIPKMHIVCPLCHKVRTNDTALAPTGYVFCYPCISKYVESNNRCPITGYPAELDHLVKLYLPDG